MKMITLILIAVLLGAIIGYHVGRSSRGATGVSPSASKEIYVSPTRQGREKKWITPQFDWSDVESDDIQKYIVNLRAIGCPEQTIGDIIRAHIFAVYQAKVNEIFNPLARYWNSADEARSLDERVNAIKLERDRLLASLNLEDSTFDSTSPVPPEKQRHVAAALKLFPKPEFALRPTVEDQARAAENRKARINYLSQLLSPAELLDYRIAQDSDSHSLASSLAGINPTSNEFRNVFAALDGENLRRTNHSLMPHLEDKLKQALGDERYVEYRKDLESDNPLVRSWGQGMGLPDDQVQQLLKLRSIAANMDSRQYRQEAGNIISDPRLLDRFLSHPLFSPTLQGGGQIK